MKDATATSDVAVAEYSTNEADMSAALDALKGAIKMIKSSKNPSLLQMQGISKTVRQAVIMADALGLDAPGLAMLQQSVDGEPAVEMENYKFHSDSIVETLENLLGKFRTEKNAIDKAEVSRAQTYHVLMQDKTDLVKAKTNELENKQAAKSKKQEDIAANSQELSVTSANLIDDQEYLAELYEISSAKAKTWDQRSKVRADELSALVSATAIVKDKVGAKTQSSTIRFAQMAVSVPMAGAVANSEDSMEAIEESAEEYDAPMGFLQKQQIKKHAAAPQDKALEGKEAVMELLRNTGEKLHSKLLSGLAVEVANQGSADVFAKIKVLIQDLIERLLAESAGESTQKGWCDKAIADAKQKREYSSDEVAELNAALADDEAKLDKFVEQIGELDDEIKGLKKSIAEAEARRTTEKAENALTVTEAEAGLSAVGDAIQILSRFYATAAKATVDLSLAQGPKDDMPDAGFEGGEAYQGAGGASGGVVGMLEVIESDFVRTISETRKAEAEAKADNNAFMTESGKSLAEKEMARGQTGKYKDAVELKLEKDGENLKAQVKILKTSIEELMELQPTCIDTGMSYADRVGRREGEVEALKKAECILNAYASFGPSGLADAC